MEEEIIVPAVEEEVLDEEVDEETPVDEEPE